MYAYITSNGEVILVGLFVDDAFATYNSTAIILLVCTQILGTLWYQMNGLVAYKVSLEMLKSAPIIKMNKQTLPHT